MRSTLVLVLLKISANLWYSEETLERLEVSTSFVELAWMSKEQKSSWNLLKPRSFGVHKNVAVLIITMLGHSEVDMKISSTGMETMESDDCKEMLEDNKDANRVLAITWEGAKFSHKYRGKFINLFTQSISGLCQVS